jgi:hypothetical protein
MLLIATHDKNIKTTIVEQGELFFNTIGLSGNELEVKKEKCNQQELRILEIMKIGQPVTPFEVSMFYNNLYPSAPITSIRRAMTCLTNKGYLIKRDEMKVEVYGTKNHCWEKIKNL